MNSPLKPPRKGGLGRGLDSLLGSSPTPRSVHGATKESSTPESISPLREVDVSLIVPNPNQPRKDFDLHELEELAGSIRRDGLLQPIVVSQRGANYYIIAGERRLRAAKMAGLTMVSVILREVDHPDDSLRLALIENIQRSDLNAMEEAEAYRDLIEKLSLTKEQCAQLVSKNLSTVYNILRLLDLPSEIKDDVRKGHLSGGHARSLLSLGEKSQRIDAARMIKDRGLSVRATEQLCRQLKNKPLKRSYRSKKARDNPTNPNLNYLADQLRSVYSTRVAVSGSADQGKIEVHYFSAEELERIISIMKGRS